MQELERNPVVGRASMEKLRNAELAYFMAVRAEETLRFHDGSEWTWEFCEPSLLIARAIESSEELQAIYDQAFEASTGEAWDLVIAYDEFTPGSLHRPDNRRKAMTVGLNFLNLGQAAISQDMTWFIPIVVRTCMIHKVQGGFGHMLKLF
jgi:hypothetical protein